MVTEIGTKVIKNVTIQKFMRNRIFTYKKGKYYILPNKPYFVK